MFFMEWIPLPCQIALSINMLAVSMFHHRNGMRAELFQPGYLFWFVPYRHLRNTKTIMYIRLVISQCLAMVMDLDACYWKAVLLFVILQ
ncbi:hypothetical protein ATO50_15175 [Aeromonas hydrophila]|nr:hypothetical protein ATO50_15175 [Aeromonas hydrophila]